MSLLKLISGVFALSIVFVGLGCNSINVEEEGVVLGVVVNPSSDLDGRYYHTVEYGDYASKIANKYGVSVSEIYACNGLQEGWFPEPGQRIKLPMIVGQSSRDRSEIWTEGLRGRGEGLLVKYERQWQAVEDDNEALLKDSRFLLSHQNVIDRVTAEYMTRRNIFIEYLNMISETGYNSHITSDSLRVMARAANPVYMSVCEYEGVFSEYLRKLERKNADGARFNGIYNGFTPLKNGGASWLDQKVVKKLKEYSLHNGAPGTHAQRIAELRAAKKDLDAATRNFQDRHYSLKQALRDFDGRRYEPVFVADYQLREASQRLIDVAQGQVASLVVDYEEFLRANGLEGLVTSGEAQLN